MYHWAAAELELLAEASLAAFQTTSVWDTASRVASKRSRTHCRAEGKTISGSRPCPCRGSKGPTRGDGLDVSIEGSTVVRSDRHGIFKIDGTMVRTLVSRIVVGHTSGIFLTTLFPRAEGVGRAKQCQEADAVNGVAEKGPVRVADGCEWLRARLSRSESSVGCSI